jgi:hypothetical protein
VTNDQKRRESFKAGLLLQKERVDVVKRLGFEIVAEGLHHFILARYKSPYKKYECRVEYREIKWEMHKSDGKPFNEGPRFWAVQVKDTSFEEVFDLLDTRQKDIAIFNFDLLIGNNNATYTASQNS